MRAEFDQNDFYLPRIRRLTLALFFSGAANILFAALMFYWAIRDRPPTPYCELKPAETIEQQAPLAIDRTNADLIRSFRSFPMEQLVARLTNTQLVENGYTQRDLALGSLVAFHHFDLSRALLGLSQPEQQRAIVYGKKTNGISLEIVVYPDLSEEQYQSIIHYAHTERWPITSKGLYALLRKQSGKFDPSLADAFFLTPEFLSVEMLFNRAEISVDKMELLKMLCEGDWQMLAAFSKQQRQTQDLSPARRQRLLLDYIEHKSKTAAYLLLKTDGSFVVKRLDDHHILAILKNLIEKTPQAEQFALSLLTSPRSDAVWQLAARRLYDYAGEDPPEKFAHPAAMARFFTGKTSGKQVADKKMITAVVAKNAKPVESVLKAGRIYIVQEGDSLWKIARKNQIDIEALKQYNKLESDFLKPGTPLKIP
jgi:hypothetical protein